jgi:hypothetical protein
LFCEQYNDTNLNPIQVQRHLKYLRQKKKQSKLDIKYIIPSTIQNKNYNSTTKEKNLHNQNVNLNYDARENINTNKFQNDEK